METELTESEQLAFENAAAWHVLRLALIRRRQELGMSQEALADQMGITQPAVSQFERLGGNPGIMTILNYAHALGVRVVLGVEPQLK